MAAIFIEDKEQGIIKISFRSKGTFSVNQLQENILMEEGMIMLQEGSLTFLWMIR